MQDFLHQQYHSHYLHQFPEILEISWHARYLYNYSVLHWDHSTEIMALEKQFSGKRCKRSQPTFADFAHTILEFLVIQTHSVTKVTNFTAAHFLKLQVVGRNFFFGWCCRRWKWYRSSAHWGRGVWNKGFFPPRWPRRMCFDVVFSVLVVIFTFML